MYDKIHYKLKKKKIEKKKIKKKKKPFAISSEKHYGIFFLLNVTLTICLGNEYIGCHCYSYLLMRKLQFEAWKDW